MKCGARLNGRGALRTAKKSKITAVVPDEEALPPELDFTLSHGQTLLVLEQLGFADGITPGTFNHYIKSLRKMGVPFDKLMGKDGRRKLARYNFLHLMEMSLILSLRVYWTVPDVVIHGIRERRATLCPFYRSAYLEAQSGLGAPQRISFGQKDHLTLSGVFLDPGIRYGGGHMHSMSEPTLLSPADALRAFATGFSTSRTHLPFNLSALALRLMDVVGILSKSGFSR